MISFFTRFSRHLAKRNFSNDVWQHYKGGLYEFICIAKHTETEENQIIYKSLKDGVIWARPFNMFFGEVVDENGDTIPRFRLHVSDQEKFNKTFLL